MKIFLYKTMTIGIIVTFFFCYLPKNSYATKVSLGIYPPLTKIKITPDTHTQEKLFITNHGDNPLLLSIEFKQFISADSRNGRIKFIPPDSKTEDFFTTNIKILDGSIPINQVLLAPQEKKLLNLDITIPKGMQTYDYYFSILFITKNTGKINANASFLSEGIATNVFLSVVTQEQQDSGYIKVFQAPLFNTNQRIPFTLELGNQTEHYITTQGNINIRNIFSISKAVIDIPPSLILGNDSRYITNFTDATDSVISWDKHPFLFGIYEADASIQFGTNPSIFHKKIYFYSYSKTSLGIFLFILIFSGTITFRILKKRS